MSTVAFLTEIVQAFDKHGSCWCTIRPEIERANYQVLGHLNARLLRAAMKTKSLFHFLLDFNLNRSKKKRKRKEPTTTM